MTGPSHRGKSRSEEAVVPDEVPLLAGAIRFLVKRRLAKRVKMIGEISQIWDETVPAPIREHTALVSFNRGTLTVAVDSAAHRYQLETLLRDGLFEIIRERFGGPLNRIRVVPGVFDALEMPSTDRIQGEHLE